MYIVSAMDQLKELFNHCNKNLCRKLFYIIRYLTFINRGITLCQISLKLINFFFRRHCIVMCSTCYDIYWHDIYIDRRVYEFDTRTDRQQLTTWRAGRSIVNDKPPAAVFLLASQPVNHAHVAINHTASRHRHSVVRTEQ